MLVNRRRVFGLGALTVAVSAAPIAGSTAAILVALAGSAGAADGVMPTKAAPISSSASPAYDWSGFYAGGHVTYSITCGWLSLVVVAALIVQFAIGAWWVDAVASLGIVWFLIREGREAWSGEECCAHH